MNRRPELEAFTVRPAQADDWPAILAAADAAAPWAADANRLWLRNRKGFDDVAGWRRHYVAVTDANNVLAYGAIECARGEKRARLFIVAPAERLRDCGVTLDALLQGDASAAGISVTWMREEAKDSAILAFASTRGFLEVDRFRREGLDMVMLERGSNR